MNRADDLISRGLVLASIWVIVACVTIPSNANPPDWVLNPPSDNINEYWGVGDGYDLDTARRTALRSVAAKLHVSVSGSIESETRVRNDVVDRAAQSRVSEVVQETEFSNVSLEKSAKYKDDFYVLVKVDRRAFVKETQAKFDSLSQEVKTELAGLEQRTPIEQFRKLILVESHIEKAIALGRLLRVAAPAFADAQTLKALETQKNQAANAAKRLVVMLKHDARDVDVARAVTSFLNAQGILVSPNHTSLVLLLTTDVKEDLLFGSKSHQLSLALQLVDDQGQTVASKQYRANGNSLDSHALARQDAVNKLLRFMNAAGPSAGLGL